jgi:hypothetical protein
MIMKPRPGRPPKNPEDRTLVDTFIKRIEKLRKLTKKTTSITGKELLINGKDEHVKFSFSEVSDLIEGLFMDAWSAWELLRRDLFISDLVRSPKSKINLGATLGAKSSTVTSKRKEATRLIEENKERKYIQWGTHKKVKELGDILFDSKHRFSDSLSVNSRMSKMVIIRDCIAHSGSISREEFKKLTKESDDLFIIPKPRYSSITPGKLLHGKFSKKSNNHKEKEMVLLSILEILSKAAQEMLGRGLPK